MTVTEPAAVSDSRTRTAPAPLATAGAAAVAAVLALGLVGVGVLCVRDAAVSLGWLGGEPWIANGLAAVVELAPSSWMTPAGIAVAVLGVVLVMIAVRPRHATAVPLDAATAVYLHHDDVAKAATAAALDVPGVLTANSRASARKVDIRCGVMGPGDDSRALVMDAVTTALQPLQRTPRITVRVRQENRS